MLDFDWNYQTHHRIPSLTFRDHHMYAAVGTCNITGKAVLLQLEFTSIDWIFFCVQALIKEVGTFSP